MPFIAGLICLGCIVLALPYLGRKGAFRVLLVMAIAVVGFVFLWWLAVPVAVIFGLGYMAKKLFLSSPDPYIESEPESDSGGVNPSYSSRDDYGPGI